VKSELKVKKKREGTLLFPKPTPIAAPNPSLYPEKNTQPRCMFTPLHVRVKGELEGRINN
jgi:hypothetical protein